MRLHLLAAGILAISLVEASAAAADPTKQECVDANSAAQDLRRVGKLREARTKLALCVSTSCPGPVREDCAQRLEEVDKVMPSIVFEAKNAAGADVSAVRVTMDGAALAEKVDGSALVVDPGEHAFRFESEGNPIVEKKLVVREGEKDRHERIVLGATPGRDAGTANMTATPESGGISRRTWGFVIGGAGAAGVVVGSIFGVMALSGSPCDSTTKTCANQPDHDTLASHETISTIGFAVGLVGIGVGTYLILTSHDGRNADSASLAPWLGFGAAGVSGTFR